MREMIDKKILFIAGHEFLYNPQNGGQKCSLRNYRILQKIFGNENVYLCMFSNYQYDNLSDNEKIFPTHKNNIELLVNTLFKRNVCDKKTFYEVKKYVQGLDIDCVFVDSSTIGYIVSKLELNVPIMCFFHNIEKNYAWNKYKHEGKKYIIAYWSYFYNEKCAVEFSDRIILLNKRDENELQRIYGRIADCFLPISFDDEFDEDSIRTMSNEKVELLFVGSLFRPNIEGLEWFIDEVMSKLDKNKFQLKVVGKNLESKRRELERKNVYIIGTVDKLSEYYYAADAVVIPIFYGDGMKVKTAEAMMYGKKILATEEALEGYIYQNVNGITRCDSADLFIKEIKEMQVDNSSFVESVRKNFLENYNTDKITQKFEVFLKDYIT